MSVKTTSTRSSTNPEAAPAASTRASTAGASIVIGSKPTLISSPPMRFLIMDAPRQSNLHLYIKEMRKYAVTHCVRVCEPTYHGGELTSAGIDLCEMAYEDGHSPPPQVIEEWLTLVQQVFYSGGPPVTDNRTIAVHCVAGLGRAPQLVAIALIEFADMDPVEAVAFIRKQRRGAINEKQLLYLEQYKKQFRKKKSSSAEASCCIIS